MLKYFDGRLVCLQSPQGLALAIILSENGLQKLRINPNLRELLGTASVCGKAFEFQTDQPGCMFVCLADNSSAWQVELEMRDIVETLENEYDFILRLIDKRYLRVLSLAA